MCDRRVALDDAAAYQGEVLVATSRVFCLHEHGTHTHVYDPALEKLWNPRWSRKTRVCGVVWLGLVGDALGLETVSV